jgi:RNA polymerase sigma-70 factor (ECF subfamily)
VKVMTITSDEHLLNHIASGDRAAFAEFYDRQAPRVLALLLRLLGQRGDAEDVLQEVFWQVWSRAHQYDAGRSTPQAWLVLLARSRALDLLRRRNGVPRAFPPNAAAAGDAASALENGELAQQLRDALSNLSEEQRSAITLAFYAGLTHEQIALRQAIPVGTVKTRIRLGMQRLRNALNHEERGSAQ